MDRQQKILIVEDEPDLRSLYTELLRSAGYNVDVVGDGEAGYQMLKNNTYDLAVLDLILPKMSGVEVLDHMKKFGSSTPVNSIVILSNVSDEAHIGDSVELGVRGYMVKSETTPDTLLTKIREFLQAPSVA